jgi:2-polyprenyl-3-methyl-5-hydroxy-6-metoxy-1,4-benzoquinol methylase
MTQAGKLTDSGERMIPMFHKGNITYGEHLGRYISVLEAIRGKVVLDIAAGSGYGTKLMASEASSVYGVDIDADAVAYAKKEYAAKNITYLQGSGTEIPLDNDSVDCVVSMETIEHIEDQEKFLEEVKRVLRPGGFVVISTPNDKVYPKGNHFHVREHNKRSLTALLTQYFKSIDLKYQVVSIAASVLEEDQLKDDDIAAGWELRKVYKSIPDESIYYLAVCGDGKLPQLQLNTLLSQEFSHMEQKKLADYIGSLNEHINNLRINLDHELSQVKKYMAENESLQQELDKTAHRRARRVARSIKRRLK